VERVDYLTLEDLLEIGQGLIPDFQVRDIGLLESAAQRPQMSLYGADAYLEFPEKVAALMHSIARNHSLIDGNKRLAWSAGRIFCILNNKDLLLKVDDAEQLILKIARGEIDVPVISSQIAAHIK
jgi:death-on-curing protein